MYQITVRAVNFEHVDAGIVGAACCLRKRRDHLIDAILCQFPWYRPAVEIGDGTGRDHRPVVPAFHFDAAIERAESMPRPCSTRFAA